jgi:hypothetical protein
VLRIDSGEVLRWPDDEVAVRWFRLFPPREDSYAAVEAKCLHCSRILTGSRRCVSAAETRSD